MAKRPCSLSVQAQLNCIQMRSHALTCAHMQSLAITCDHVHSLVFTCDHTHSLAFTCIHLHWLALTFIHLHSFAISCNHLHSLLFVFPCFHFFVMYVGTTQYHMYILCHSLLFTSIMWLLYKIATLNKIE